LPEGGELEGLVSIGLEVGFIVYIGFCDRLRGARVVMCDRRYRIEGETFLNDELKNKK